MELSVTYSHHIEAHPGLSQTSKKKGFTKVVNSLKPLITVIMTSIFVAVIVLDPPQERNQSCFYSLLWKNDQLCDHLKSWKKLKLPRLSAMRQSNIKPISVIMYFTFFKQKTNLSSKTVI